MSIRVALLAGTQGNTDTDLSKSFFENIRTPGVITGLNISWWQIQPWVGLIECERTSGETLIIPVIIDTAVTVDTTGTKKIYLEVDQDLLDDGTDIPWDNTGVVSVQTGWSYPSTNFLKIADVTSSVVTDEREFSKVKLDNAQGANAWKMYYTDANGVLQEVAIWTSGKFLVSQWDDQPPTWTNTTSEWISMSVTYWEDITVSGDWLIWYFWSDGKVYVSDVISANKFHCWISESGSTDTVHTVVIPPSLASYSWVEWDNYIIRDNGAIQPLQNFGVNANGTDEYIQTTTATTLSFSNAFTIVFWFIPTSITVNDKMLWIAQAAWTNNNIEVERASWNKLRVLLKNSSWTYFKDFTTSVTFTPWTLYRFGLTFDGTNLKLYQNGVEDSSPTKSTDSAWTMTDTSRHIAYLAQTSWSNYSDAIWWTLAFWSVALDATNMLATYASWLGFALDLSTDFGSYNQSANIKHLYFPWRNTSAIGDDYVGNVDLDAGANITSADVTTLVSATVLAWLITAAWFVKVWVQRTSSKLQLALPFDLQ